ncbi:rhodanese-like domain-containing protein [Hafnia alvei]|uniref:rhodanese-like domain-containing protein n=1 Tax=Hafnia alvei TaxID=569 RepID=UPI000DF9EF5E|nr:rhodanese-like domain-containing protein [Hafnia alvei]STQ70031.1 Thiosulfate sulfurtransferase PspE precursor [Hafnia alvei]
MTSLVSRIPAADSIEAEHYFARRFQFETDCSDVHACLQQPQVDFVLLDVRSPALYQQSHLPQAINIPHKEMDQRLYQRFARETLFVVHCAGPHCNGAQKAALKLSQLGYPVKEMIGGVMGWQDEGFSFAGQKSKNAQCGC